jgi:hypothetical protein
MQQKQMQQTGTDQRQAQVAGGIQIVGALWLVVSPWMLAYAGQALALWNNLIVGVVVAVLAGLGLARPDQSSWGNGIILVLGLWLIAAPFVLGFAATPSLLWNNLVVGVVVAALGAWRALAMRR